MRMFKGSRRWALGLVLLLLPVIGQAMPNFARKYEKNCGMCHTQVPQLNKTGYEFRMAGYRLPDEIGQEEKDSDFNLGDYFAVRMTGAYTVDRLKPAGGTRSSTDQLEFDDAGVYALTGSWGGNFASQAELDIAPGEEIEIANAYIRGVYGDEKGWFQGRIGVMHPWEGFGASDRPIGISRPLIQETQAAGSPFLVWAVPEMAVEGGYYSAISGTSIAARIGNGILWTEDGEAEGAQGGALSKDPSLPASNSKSYQLVLNQILLKESGVTAYYYRTSVPSPNPVANPPPAALTTDTLERMTLYANAYVWPKTVNLLAGYGWGEDRLDDPTLNPDAGKSRGWFGQVDYFPIEHELALGVRYDVLDPSKNVDRNSVNAIAAFANWMPRPGLQVLCEYRRTSTEAGATPGEDKDDRLQLLFTFIK